MNRTSPFGIGMFGLGSLWLIVGGCAYDENLPIANLKGRVFVPKAATTRTIAREDGTEEVIGPDVKLIGPVYLGLYPSIYPANVVERFPHPEVGPQYLEGVTGDAYPYGGTTVGDLRFACFEFLTCKLSSGRFLDFQEIVDWFAYLEQPVVDAAGSEIQDGDFIRQTCFDMLNVTGDDEIRITAYEDRDGDGAIDKGDLDFVDYDDEYWMAEFTVWQQEMFWDQNQEDCTPGVDPDKGGCKGFQLWGWMDAPSTLSYQFSTCDPANGFLFNEYNNLLVSGRPYEDVLNFPASYIAEGDYTAPEGYIWSDIYDQPDIYLDFAVQ
jgi:hypothetical protein